VDSSSRSQESCIWNCGEIADSDEDVLPTWMRNRLGAKAGRKRWLLSDLTPAGQPSPPANPRPGERRGMRVVARRIVCQTCNNGWMSQLQTSAKPLLAGMLDGEPQNLRAGDQHTLLTWSTMTAITNQYCSRETVEAFRREYLFAHRSPPSNTEAYLCHMPRATLDTMHSASRWRDKNDHDRVYAYFDLIAIRLLAVIIVQGKLPAWLRKPLDDASTVLVRLEMPVDLRPIAWPAESMTTGEVQDLFDRLTSMPAENA
jgi:hypothetical protein